MSEGSEEFTPEMVTNEMIAKLGVMGLPVSTPTRNHIREMWRKAFAKAVTCSPLWAEYKKLRELNKRYKSRIECLTDELSEYQPDIRDLLVPLEGLEN